MGAIDDAHTAFTDPLFDAIVRDSGSEHQPPAGKNRRRTQLSWRTNSIPGYTELVARIGIPQTARRTTACTIGPRRASHASRIESIAHRRHREARVYACTRIPSGEHRRRPALPATAHARRRLAASRPVAAIETTVSPAPRVSAIARTTSEPVESGGSFGSPIQRSVTRTPLSQIGPTMRRSARRPSRPRSSRSWARAAARAAPGRRATLSCPTTRAATSATRHDHEPGQPRRHVVHHVVEPRAAPAEAQIARRLVADHRVHRADDLEQHEPRQPAEHVPEHRADEAVGQVLAEALDRGAPAGGAVHAIGVAADERAHGAARARRDRRAAPPTRSARRGAARSPSASRAVDAGTRAPARPRASTTDSASATTSRDMPASHTAAEQDEEQDAAAVAVERRRAAARASNHCSVRPIEPHRMRSDRPGRPAPGRSRRRPPAAAGSGDSERRAQSPVRHFSDQPSATARENQRLRRRLSHEAAASRGTRASGGPARPDSPRASPPAAPSHRRRPTPAACRSARDRARPPARAPPRRRAARRSAALLFFLSSSRSRCAQSSGAMSSNSVASLHAVSAERVKHAARVARFEAVLPAQRLQRRVCASRGRSSSPSFMCGLADVSGLAAGQRRGDAGLIGAGAGREIDVQLARHRQPLQRGALALRHRDHHARQRGGRQRPVDEQHRVDRAGVRGHLLHAGVGLAPGRRLAGGRWRCPRRRR